MSPTKEEALQARDLEEAQAYAIDKRDFNGEAYEAFLDGLHAERSRSEKLVAALEKYANREAWYSRKIPLGNGTEVSAPGFGLGPNVAEQALEEFRK